ncbi:polysaccharide biosynthesis C-terminal domain-containing protein [candidate division KSB1 bacterium]|nr:polysaccharide biosynthesis C-terminal domain-containing protein [candidate division KSB1 bacterium]
MFNKIKKTIKHSAFYSLGNISSKLVGFILLPIYTRQISVADYGVLGLFEAMNMLGVAVGAMGLYQGLLRWHNLSKSEVESKRLVGTVFLFLLIMGGLLTAPTVLFREQLSIFFFKEGGYQTLFVYLALAVSFRIFGRLELTLLRNEEKSLFYSVCIATQFTVSLILNILFVAILKIGIRGILISQAISNGLLFLILLPYLLKRISFSPMFGVLRKMLKFSFPLMLATAAATLIAMGDRYLFSMFGTLHDLGLYNLGYKFSNILKMFVVDAFALGLPVIGWQMIRNDNTPKRFFSKLMTYLVFGLSGVALALSLFTREIIEVLLDPAYLNAYIVVPFLLYRVVLLGMQKIYFFELQIPKKTHLITVILLIEAVIDVGLNIYMIPRWGIIGAGCSISLAFTIATLLAYWLAQRHYPVVYETRRLMIILLITVGLFALSLIFSGYGFGIRLIVKSLIVLLYPTLFFVVKFFESVELERIRDVAVQFHILKPRKDTTPQNGI